VLGVTVVGGQSVEDSFVGSVKATPFLEEGRERGRREDDGLVAQRFIFLAHVMATPVYADE